MSPESAPTSADTRVARNQPPPLVGHDTVSGDAALMEGMLRYATPEDLEALLPLGRLAGSNEAREHGLLANRFTPELHTHDRYGNRVDEVDFHPSWHWSMEQAVGMGLQAAPWEREEVGAEHAHVRRAAGFMAWFRSDFGHACPVTMTYAAVPALRADDALAKEWVPRLAATTYDPGLRAPHEKASALAGMGMTEKQGGSDVAPTRPRHAKRTSRASTRCRATSGSPPHP